MHHVSFFFFTPPPPPQISPLSLHDALPISGCTRRNPRRESFAKLPQSSDLRYTPAQQSTHPARDQMIERSEEHTSELQSPYDLVCRLLLEKKKKKNIKENRKTISDIITTIK